MKKLLVKTETSSYPVLIGHNIFNSLKEKIKGERFFKNIFVIADGNVLKYYGHKIENILKPESLSFYLHSLKPGESSKSYETLNKIYSALLKNNFGRDTLIVAVGGGVTGDIAGYAASTFMRGVQLVHIPTTLLAAVDSSVGGKTGFNFQDKKNIIGTFYQPQMVLIDTEFLNTLPKREFTSGLGEIIKYSFLTNSNFYNYVIKLLPGFYECDQRNFEKLIYESVEFKSSVVAADEKENGIRKILNFGHTFAHAFESALNFKIKHGEAVIAGIISALFLSGQKGLANKAKLKQFLAPLDGIKLPSKLKNVDKLDVYRAMMHDKKNRMGKINFVLIRGIGEIVTDVQAGKKEVLLSLESALKFIS